MGLISRGSSKSQATGAQDRVGVGQKGWHRWLTGEDCTAGRKMTECNCALRQWNLADTLLLPFLRAYFHLLFFLL